MRILHANSATAMMLIFVGLGPRHALAEEQNERSVYQYTCKDIMRESGTSRDVSIAFVHAYLLGKSNATTFNVSKLHKETEAFIDYCLDNPDTKALEAMIKIKG